MATIKNRLESDDGGTRVVAETELHVTGPQAQFGKGVMQDVGGRVLDEFSSCLERQISVEGEEEQPSGDGEQATGAESSSDARGPDGSGSDGAGRARTAAGEGARTAEADDALDLGSMLVQSKAGQYARIAAIVLVALILIRLVSRRR